ncbi:glycosyltransferase family 4 protein [Dyadobacter chenwenxiniae]|uniref:Glycosyltransferase family 4 protein n=1 Tax=Dyadobacter chenwenxiniae TaxID=2906456 RepID=A0A9X1TEJ8_9BACT|nr:glycosyltransferase family 1 protein [Dyadobacter chenwenxiniae]MCF0061719.1 glycosyltransferase family 4 protein [Dyadobacter chenwenxiniae]UON81537.1 glycosyltransferase family 4 protein [Dyadobacter chenwenxiniae]
MKRVLVTFDSMKDLNCGYFSFGKGLGDAIVDCNEAKFELSYYIFKQNPYLFENRVRFIYFSKLHKFHFSAKNQFDIVHLTDQTCRLRPTNVNAKRILTIHDLNKIHLGFSNNSSIQRYLSRLKYRIDSCDKIVAISNFVANDIKTIFPEAQNKLSVIYNGVDKLISAHAHVPVFCPPNEFIFTIGLLSIQKGFHYLPALLRNNNYDLIISGIETPHKEVILRVAAKYNVKSRVHITGPISEKDKAWYYKNCSAFVFPSRAEGFGLPVIEAMQFGKPVFLSKFTSLPEIGGKHAYYFDNFEDKHMEEVFNVGMADFVRRNCADEVKNYADSFTWNKAASAYLSLYESLL